MADSTLAAIRTKVRRLTHSPSDARLTTAQIDEYVNTFILYDFPESLRLFSLRQTLTFYTQPNVDLYETNTTDTTHPLYQFKDRIIAVHKPVFVDGYNAYLTQSREEFAATYTVVNQNADTGLTGDGMSSSFTGTLQDTPVLQRNVTFSVDDGSGESLILVDYPVSNTTGALGLVGQPQTLPSPYGSVNYVDGSYSLNFPSAPGDGKTIYVSTLPYTAARPKMMLFFNNQMKLRPVPDKTYPVIIEVDVRPTELLASGSSPDLEQWWQYVAYGAAKKVFEDRMEMESVASIMPEFKNQETLVLRRTIVNQTKERVATIYTQGSGVGYGWRYSNDGNF